MTPYDRPGVPLGYVGGYAFYDLSELPELEAALGAAIPPDKDDWPRLSGYYLENWEPYMGPVWTSMINRLRYLAREGLPPSPSQGDLAAAIGAGYSDVVKAFAFYRLQWEQPITWRKDPEWDEVDRVRWIGAHAYIPLITPGKTHGRKRKYGRPEIASGGKRQLAYHVLGHDAPQPLKTAGLEWYVGEGQLFLRLAEVPNPPHGGLGTRANPPAQSSTPILPLEVSRDRQALGQGPNPPVGGLVNRGTPYYSLDKDKDKVLVRAMDSPESERLELSQAQRLHLSEELLTLLDSGSRRDIRAKARTTLSEWWGIQAPKVRELLDLPFGPHWSVVWGAGWGPECRARWAKGGIDRGPSYLVRIIEGACAGSEPDQCPPDEAITRVKRERRRQEEARAVRPERAADPRPKIREELAPYWDTVWSAVPLATAEAWLGDCYPAHLHERILVIVCPSGTFIVHLEKKWKEAIAAALRLAHPEVVQDVEFVLAPKGKPHE